MANKISDHQAKFMRSTTTQSSLPSIETVCRICCSSCDLSDLIIAQIYDGAETFEYRMLSLEDLELRSFNRIERSDSTSGTSLPEKRTAADQQSTRHYPPFYTLPPLISRAKPHFVICDTAAKLHHWPTIGPVYSAKLRSVWHGHEFSPFSMTISMQGTYDTWFACDVPPSFASIPRVLVPIPPLYPYSTVTERTLSKACIGPCVNSRTAWMSTPCLPCSGWQRNSVGDPDLAHSDGDGDLDIGEQVDRMAQYRAYLSRVARCVNDWQSCCMQQVKKRERWTSSLVNTKQLRDYAQEPPRNLGQRGGTPCAGCCCHSIRAQPVRCNRGVQTSG